MYFMYQEDHRLLKELIVAFKNGAVDFSVTIILFFLSVGTEDRHWSTNWIKPLSCVTPDYRSSKAQTGTRYLDFHALLSRLSNSRVYANSWKFYKFDS